MKMDVLHFSTNISIARLRALEERDEEDFKRHQQLQENPPEDASVLCPIPKPTRSRQHLRQWAPVCKPPRYPWMSARRVHAIWGLFLRPAQEPDWGVHVLELLFNFYLLTGQRMLVNHEWVPKVNKFFLLPDGTALRRTHALTL